MHALRVLSLLIGGGLFAVFGPMCILAGMNFQDPDPMSPMTAVLIAIGLVVAHTAGFLFVGIYGDRVLRSAAYRAVAALLLVTPIATLGTRMVTTFHSEEALIFVPIVALAMVLLSAYVWPVWIKSANPPVNEDAPDSARPLP